MKEFRSLLLLILLVVSSSIFAQQVESPPNILWIVSDDQRADTIAALGNDAIQTPSLDRLVRMGTSFSRAYCMGSTSGAVCAPSRYMLMTGRSLHRLPGNVFDIPVDEVTLPQQLRKAGWDTFFSGKWHNGKSAFHRSFSAGGEIFLGGMGSHTDLRVHDYDPEGKYANEKRHRLPHFSSTAFTDAAIDFLNTKGQEKSKGPPFLACVFFTAPHDPRTPPQEFKAMYPPEQLPLPANFLPEHPFDNGEMKIRDEKLAPWPRTPEVVKEHLGDYYGMISQLDSQVGRLLEALQKNGLWDTTIVIFTSDHGLAVGSHGLLGKQNLYEHSIRVPLVMTGPGIAAGRSCDLPVYLHDLVPTISGWAGIAAPPASEGSSLVPTLRDLQPDKWREGIYSAYKNIQRALRVGRWKVIRYPAIDRTQLFDLEADPDEMIDLSGTPEHAQTLAQMLSRLRKFRIEAADPLVKTTDSR